MNAGKTVRCESVARRRGGGLSNHFLVEARLKLVGNWRSAGRMDGVRNVLKVSELNNSVKERAYQEACVENMKCGEVGKSKCGELVGKIQRYSNGVYQRCMWHEMCRRAEKKGE